MPVKIEKAVFTTVYIGPVSGVARSLVLAGHLLYASSRESNNASARARFARDRVTLAWCFGRARSRPCPAFATSLGPVQLVQTCLYAGNILQSRFHSRNGAVKHVQACLSASKDRGSSFHLCVRPVKLVQACLCTENTLQIRLNSLGSAVKHVEACLSATKDGEAVFITVEVL